jgi:hypothetical protein
LNPTSCLIPKPFQVLSIIKHSNAQNSKIVMIATHWKLTMHLGNKTIINKNTWQFEKTNVMHPLCVLSHTHTYTHKYIIYKDIQVLVHMVESWKNKQEYIQCCA